MTGCVYSKACNFIVTVGTDCDGMYGFRTMYSFQREKTAQLLEQLKWLKRNP